jgi:hypothetical protein
MGRMNGRSNGLLLGNLQGRICIYKGGRLYNSVSRSLREEMSISLVNKGAKTWVKEKIPIKPKS